MYWKRIIIALTIFQISVIPVFGEPPEVGEIEEFRGKVTIIGEDEEERSPKKEKGGKVTGGTLYKGDRIVVHEEGSCSGYVGGEIADFPSDRRCTFDFRKKSEVEIIDILRFMVTVGDAEFKPEKMNIKVDTHYSSTAAPGTRFRVVSSDAGTFVDVLNGKVHLTRKHGQKYERENEPTEIIKGYQGVIDPIEQLSFSIDLQFQRDFEQVSISEELLREFEKKGIYLSPNSMISVVERDSKWLITDIESQRTYSVIKKDDYFDIYNDRPLRIMSPRPLWVQAGLLLMPPGVSRLYGYRDRRRAITSTVSTGVLLGILYTNGEREKYVKSSIRTYDVYKDEIMPGKIPALYEQHSQDRKKAKISRNREIGLIIIYGALFAYETAMTIKEGREYNRMAKEFLKSKDKILSAPRVVIEKRDGASISIRKNTEF